MTEHDWLACNDPWELWRFIKETVQPQRFRWLTVEWGRRIRHLYNPEDTVWFDAYAAWVEGVGEHPSKLDLPENQEIRFDHRGFSASDYAETFIGSLRRHDIPALAVRWTADCAGLDFPQLPIIPTDYTKTHRSRSSKKREAAKAKWEASEEKARAEAWRFERDAHKERICWEFCNQFRDVAGNPFRPVVADPAWFTPTVLTIAESLYEARAFDRLPILADALEEAGCTSADLLLHCRQPGEHVRGCWAVDLVLGKE